MKIRQWILASVAMASLLSALNAQAQWVMVARAVAGRIERMTNKPSNGSGYDVATVVLKANASKVYQTALQVMETRPDITITNKDEQTANQVFQGPPSSESAGNVSGRQRQPVGGRIEP